MSAGPRRNGASVKEGTVPPSLLSEDVTHPSIEDYAIIGDCRSRVGAALIGLSGYLGGDLVYEHGVWVGED